MIRNLNLLYNFDGNKNVSEVFYLAEANGIGAHYDYAPFGAVCRTTRATRVTGFDAIGQNPFRFSSEFHDPELDLVYYNYRHYSPTLGRFLSRDPIEEQGGLNLYAFVKNNCMSTTDGNGKEPYRSDELSFPDCICETNEEEVFNLQSESIARQLFQSLDNEYYWSYALCKDDECQFGYEAIHNFAGYAPSQKGQLSLLIEVSATTPNCKKTSGILEASGVVNVSTWEISDGIKPGQMSGRYSTKVGIIDYLDNNVAVSAGIEGSASYEHFSGSGVVSFFFKVVISW